jgi:hypothetical protein
VILAIFEPNDELTAIFRIAGIALWALSAIPFGGRFSGRLGGSIGLVGLGLAVFFFPNMWQEADAAFNN